MDDKLIKEDNPRYRFPGERKRDGKIFEFRKTLFLYNGFRIEAPVDDLIVVEGFTGVWWLDQNGLSNVVGTMGADCSEKQAELIMSLVKPDGMVWIIPDGRRQSGGATRPNAADAHFTSPRHAVVEVDRWQTTDGFVGGRIENELPHMKRTATSKGVAFQFAVIRLSPVGGRNY